MAVKSIFHSMATATLAVIFLASATQLGADLIAADNLPTGDTTTDDSVIQDPIPTDSICPVLFDRFNCIVVSPSDSMVMRPAENDALTVSLDNQFSGTLSLNLHQVWMAGLHPFITNGTDTILLTPELTELQDGIRLLPDSEPYAGDWTLEIPEGYFLIDPAFVETDSIPASHDSLVALQQLGAWHVAGSEWDGAPMMSIHDDDAIDTSIASSSPSAWMRGGYFTTLYPVLESLGLTGCISAEGRRIGFTDYPPTLNANGRLIRRLQDEKGWEVQSHSMLAVTSDNNWYVDSLAAPEADEILSSARYYGSGNISTTTIYDGSTGIQYSVNADLSGWTPSRELIIKPYVRRYPSGERFMYNPNFSIDYQWGRWFSMAEAYGLHANAWVTYESSSSHANVPLINQVCPNGFETDGYTFHNLPPLRSTATRLMMEGQSIHGYQGQLDTINTFNEAHYEYFKQKIDDAFRHNGWLVMGMHAYRPCWVNRLPGALVSEGGDYPDEWVNPMCNLASGEYPDSISFDVRPELGISSWSEWHPCPGTRLYMLWQLLRYARDMGFLNVNSSRGFEVMGNRVAVGYCHRGIPIGPDLIEPLTDTAPVYPHYIVGANGEQYYYNNALSGAISMTVHVAEDISTEVSQPALSEECQQGPFEAVSIDGLHIQAESIRALPKGLWIVNGRKILVSGR